MDIISRDKHFASSLRVKFGVNYILIIAAVLILLNTYPLLVSENLVFRSKSASMQNSISVVVSSLGGLDHLTRENVAGSMSVVENAGLSRILVTDASGRILYDTREMDNALGQYTFYTEIVQALKGNDAFTCSYRDGAFRSRCATPILYQNQIIGAVYAYEYDTNQASLLAGFQSNIQRLSVMIAALVLLFTIAMSKSLTGQIRELLEAISRVREGAYSHRASIHGHDEIARLGEEFNSLTDRLQKTEDARRRFVSDASHELKTPLAAIRLLTDSILQTPDIDDATTREFVSDIGLEAERLSRITEDLLELTRMDSNVLASPEPVEVERVLERVLRMMKLVAAEKQVEITCTKAEKCRVLASQDEVHQVIYNLVDNAVKYTGPGGHVEVSLSAREGRAILCVADDGVGIPEEDIPRIFERFYRVDKARSRDAGGTGLGLSIVSDTVKKRGGTVTAANRPEGGAAFTAEWPLYRGGRKAG